MGRTASTEAGRKTVDASAALYLVYDDFTAVSDTLLQLLGLVKDSPCAEASSSGNGGNG